MTACFTGDVHLQYTGTMIYTTDGVSVLMLISWVVLQLKTDLTCFSSVFCSYKIDIRYVEEKNGAENWWKVLLQLTDEITMDRPPHLLGNQMVEQHFSNTLIIRSNERWAPLMRFTEQFNLQNKGPSDSPSFIIFPQEKWVEILKIKDKRFSRKCQN